MKLLYALVVLPFLILAVWGFDQYIDNSIENPTYETVTRSVDCDYSVLPVDERGAPVNRVTEGAPCPCNCEIARDYKTWGRKTEPVKLICCNRKWIKYDPCDCPYDESY